MDEIVRLRKALELEVLGIEDSINGIYEVDKDLTEKRIRRRIARIKNLLEEMKDV